MIFNCICLDEGYLWENSDLPHVFNAGEVAEAGTMNASQAILRNALNSVLQSSDTVTLHTSFNGEVTNANEVNENFLALKTGASPLQPQATKRCVKVGTELGTGHLAALHPAT